MIICVLYLLSLKEFLPIDSGITDIENWDIGKVVQNKGQAITGMGKGEYLPVRANDSRLYLMERNDDIYVLDGSAEISDYSKNGQELYANIKTNDAILELPYIYYPGYKITLDGENLYYEESINGFIEIQISNSGTLEVKYTGTTLMHISGIISIIGIIGLVVYIVICQKKRN